MNQLQPDKYIQSVTIVCNVYLTYYCSPNAEKTRLKEKPPVYTYHRDPGKTDLER